MNILVYLLLAVRCVWAWSAINLDFGNASQWNLVKAENLTESKMAPVSIDNGILSVMHKSDYYMYACNTSSPTSGSCSVAGYGLKGHPFGEKAIDVQLSFYVSFFNPNGSDFDFAGGGKLFGLAFGGGETSCTGGRNDPSCYSARVNWRAGGDAEVYVYTQDPNLQYDPESSRCYGGDVQVIALLILVWSQCDLQL